MRTHRPTALLLALSGALLMSACSTPKLARWAAPPAGPGAATNLDAGRAEAAAARKAYQDVVDAYVQEQGNVGNGLLGLGLLATVLAASSAHRDAVVGTGFLAGSVYAFGQFNISKQRALIHQAGVEALDCAVRAVAPLSMTVADQQALDKLLGHQAITALALTQAQAALRQARTAAAQPLGAAQNAAVEAVLAASITAQEAGRRAQTGGRQLAVKARGASEQLRQAVLKIDNAVVRANLDTLTDLSALPKVVSSAAVFAGQLVPGADGFINEALARREKALTETAKAQSTKLRDGTQVTPDRDVEMAQHEVQRLTDQMLGAVGDIQALLDSHAAAQAADPLKDCGVADIAFPLKASADKLSFPGGTDATKTVVLSGGTKPYVVELADSPEPGLSVKGPAPFESRLQVTVTKSLQGPQSFSVLVMDSSSPMKTVVLPVEVGAQAGAPGAESTPIAPAAAEDLPTRINRAGPFDLGNGVKLRLSGLAEQPAGSSKVNVRLRCEPAPPPACVPPAEARRAIAAKLGLKADDAALQALVLKGPNCLCGS
ncbi:MAG: hypothetical protein ACK44A_14400 [Roseateles sp.]